MNTLPKHDAETGDIRGSEPFVTKTDDIAIGDLPNSDTATDDMRGHEPAPETDVESDHTKMIVGAVFAVVVLGAIGSYATGMWNSAAPAPATRVAAIIVPAPVRNRLSSPLPFKLATPAVVESAPVPAPAPAHVAKRAAVPSHRPIVQAQPKSWSCRPRPHRSRPCSLWSRPRPKEPTGGLPTPPATEPAAQALPDQPVAPAPAP